MQQSADTTYTTANSVTGTAYSPSRTDGGRVLETTNAAAVTVTLPPTVTAGWLIGTTLQVYQAGAGQVTLAGAVGVTLRSAGGKLRTAAQYSVISLRMRANDEWVIWGDSAV